MAANGGTGNGQLSRMVLDVVVWARLSSDSFTGKPGHHYFKAGAATTNVRWLRHVWYT